MLGIGAHREATKKNTIGPVTEGRSIWATFDKPNKGSLSPELIDNGTFDNNNIEDGSGTVDWNLGSRWSATDNKLKHTAGGSGNEAAQLSYVASGTIVSGGLYKVTCDLVVEVGNGPSAKIGNAASTTPLNHGIGATTYLTAGSTTNFLIFIDANSSTTFTIDNISVKHVTSYTGQALEFDGVSDEISFDTPVCGGNTEMTLATWFQKDVGATGAIAGYNTGGTYIRFTTSTNLLIYFDGVDANFSYNTTFTDDGNWHYLVVTYNGATGAEFYLDGVLTSPTVAGANDVVTGSLDSESGSIARIGNYASVGSTLFSGKMANFQIWNKEWSAADVTYAWNNAEKLASNNVSSSLTYSDIALWYPAQETVRGLPMSSSTTSALLDGANTSISDSVVQDGLFQTDQAGALITYHGPYWSTERGWSIADGKATFNHTSAGYIYTAGSVADLGVVYKINFTVDRDAGSIRVYAGTTRIHDDISSSGAYTVYGLQAGNNDIKFYALSTFRGSISKVSAQAINPKNNGSSLFYGEELNTEQNAISPSGVTEANDTSGWTSTGTWGGQALTSSSTDPHSGLGSYHFHAKASADGDRLNTEFTVVEGRQYSVSYYYKVLNGDSGSSLQVRGGSSASGYDYFIGSVSTGSWTQVTHTFTAAGTTFYFQLNETGGDNDAEFYFDDLSLKELGFAEGWTSANNQPIIPQLAFQNHNFLRYWDGYDDKVSIAGQSIGTNDWSWSFWFIAGDSHERIMGAYGPVQVYMSSGFPRVTFYDDAFNINPSTGLAEPVQIHNQVSRVDDGKWHHCALVMDRSDLFYFYIDGSLHGSYDISDMSGESVTSGSLDLGHANSTYGSGTSTELSTWRAALTASQVGGLYNNGSPIDANLYATDNNLTLTGYWRAQASNKWEDLSDIGVQAAISGSPEAMIVPESNKGDGRDTQGFPINNIVTNGLNFQSSNDGYIDLGATTTIAAGTAFSIMAWIKPTDVSNNYWFGESANDYFRIVDSTSIFICANNNTFDFTVPTITVNQWWHVAFVRASDNSTKIYMNGILRDTVAVAQPFDYRYIGNRDTAETFRGQVDDMAIHNATELSAEQILRNYNVGKRRHKN